MSEAAINPSRQSIPGDEYLTVTASENGAGDSDQSRPGATGRRLGDASLKWVTRSAAGIILIMIGLLVAVLVMASMPTIKKYGWSFVTGDEWRVNAITRKMRDAKGRFVKDDDDRIIEEVIKPPVYGALPVIYGTVMSSAIAVLLAVPLGFGAALFLVRIAPRGFAQPVSFMIEFLAAIPSIAYGIWAMFVLTPFFGLHAEPFFQKLFGMLPGSQWLFQQKIEVDGQVSVVPLVPSGKDMLAGGLVLAIMILPIITAISRDVLRAVPRTQIEGTMALGATWWQSSKAMLRYSRSALFGAVMLGLARAAGETMAVTMAIGNKMIINPSPFAPSQTMSSLLANQSGDPSDPLHVSALTEIALILLLMSIGFNVIARWLVVGGSSRTSSAH